MLFIRKKNLSLFIVILLSLFILSGCGGGSNSENNGISTQTDIQNANSALDDAMQDLEKSNDLDDLQAMNDNYSDGYIFISSETSAEYNYSQYIVFFKTNIFDVRATIDSVKVTNRTSEEKTTGIVTINSDSLIISGVDDKNDPYIYSNPA